MSNNTLIGAALIALVAMWLMYLVARLRLSWGAAGERRTVSEIEYNMAKMQARMEFVSGQVLRAFGLGLILVAPLVALYVYPDSFRPHGFSSRAYALGLFAFLFAFTFVSRGSCTESSGFSETSDVEYARKRAASINGRLLLYSFLSGALFAGLVVGVWYLTTVRFWVFLVALVISVVVAFMAFMLAAFD